MNTVIRIVAGRERRLLILSGILVLFLMVTAVAWAQSASMTRGDIDEFLDGEARYDDIAGHATMIRAPGGKTNVTIHVTGLAPSQTYPSHVHNAPCSEGGGVHYKHDPIGSSEPPNEIWLNFTTNAAGIGNSQTQAAFWARDDAQAIVVHDYTDLAKVACADLVPVP